MNVSRLKGNGRIGTLKHRLVLYVANYPKDIFYVYTLKVVSELKRRKIRYQEKYLDEIRKFCRSEKEARSLHYPEHNERYLKQCYFNLQEKYDRGIIAEGEFRKIEEKIQINRIDKSEGI